MATPSNSNIHNNNAVEEIKGPPKKKSNGRRKIPIQHIVDKTRKHVTFSKRRAGLFKKASELCALCGVEMAILTFSERGKLFCFGHPDPDDVIHRYLTNGGTHHAADDDVTFSEFNLMVGEHNRSFEGVKMKIDEERKFAEQGQNWNNEEKSHGFWWDEAKIDEMGLDELEQFMGCLVELRNNVAKQVDKQTGANLSFHSTQMGNIMVDQISSNHNDKICNLGYENTSQNYFNNNLNLGGMLSDSPYGGRMTMVEEANIDIVAHQRFSFEFMGGMEENNNVQDFKYATQYF